VVVVVVAGSWKRFSYEAELDSGQLLSSMLLNLEINQVVQHVKIFRGQQVLDIRVVCHLNPEEIRNIRKP